MRIHWVSAVVLSSAIAVGCSDRGNQNSQNNQENQGPAPAATAPADQDQANREAVSPNADTADRHQPEGTRPTNGTRATARQRAESRDARSRSFDTAPVRPTEPRSDERAAHGDAPAPAPREEFREVTVPAGTALPLELLTPLSSDTAQVETPVRARVRQAVTVDGYTAIPAGSTLTGTVTDVAQAGRVQGKSRLAFRFNEIDLRGTRERISTNPLSYEGEATKGKDATKIGAGAGIGAAIGGLLGGGSGAAKGAAIGGAAGTGVVLATRGKEVELAEGTDLAATLADSVKINVPVR